MIGGLVTSTLFTLLVLPALYLLVKRAPSRSPGPLGYSL
jgi:Cu/Ag efflux pump CusA